MPIQWSEMTPEQKNRHKEYTRSYRARNQKILREARDKPCARCGGKYHFAAMDLHHRDPNEKELKFGENRPWSEARLRAEIAKCDVLCANCHRVHHYKRNERGPRDTW